MATSTARSAESRAKILVVDDDPDNRSAAQATLEEEGYAVVTAATGEDGIRAFQRERPDCILLDVRMPGKDGFAVCDRIRRLSGGTDTPIIFVTGWRDVETFDRALRAGGDDFLTKPVSPTKLILRVQTALRLRRMSFELRERCDLIRRQRDGLMRLQLGKEELTAFVVHDLRGPVHAIDQNALLVLGDGTLTPGTRESIRHIRDDARSLSRLIQDLLDISKSDDGVMVAQFAEVDLEALATGVLDALDQEGRARAAGVTLTHTIEVRSGVVDGELLRRVLENLLDNATHHAPRGTTVHLAIVARDGSLEFRVTDAGPGIPPAMRERLFERRIPKADDEDGEDADPRTRGGLGLAFCKLAVMAHGGRIWVEDGNPGAVFCVRVPRLVGGG